MRPATGEFSGLPADPNSGYTQRARDGGYNPKGKEGTEDEKTNSQRADRKSEGGTEKNLRSGSDLDRRIQCHYSADDHIGDRYRHEWIPDGEPFRFVAGPDSEPRCQRGQNRGTGEEKSAEPGCDGTAHGGDHVVKQQELPGRPVSAS